MARMRHNGSSTWEFLRDTMRGASPEHGDNDGYMSNTRVHGVCAHYEIDPPSTAVTAEEYYGRSLHDPISHFVLG